jgi:two-component system sensor kinase FixL
LAQLLDRIRAEDRAALRVAIEAAVTTAAELDCVMRVTDRHGRLRWVALRGGLAGDGAVEDPLLRGVLADVTDRRERDERVSVVANASPIGVAMVNRAGVIVFANPRMETLFGYGPGELLGLSIERLVPPDLRDRHVSHRGGHFSAGLARAMQGGRDVVGIRKDGREVVVEVSLVNEELDGEPVALASVVDQGWRREAEREMARQRDELALLTRAALLGELSGSLAHELNQPLTSILINAQASQQLVAQGRLDPATLDEILVDIVSDTRRAGDVIQRLRTLLRHGRSSMERVDLETIAQEVLRLLGGEFVGRGVSVTTAFEPGLPPVFGDRVQLQQVVLNLLMNACEAMADQPGPRRVQVDTQRSPDGWVRLQVVDAGPGIAQDKLERIFDAFVTTKAEGLGLGLALCRRIIEHHGGSMVASNNATGGATFAFSLRPAPTTQEGQGQEQER